MARRDFIRECSIVNTIPAKPVPGILLIGGAEGKKSREGSATQWFSLSKEQIGAII